MLRVLVVDHDPNTASVLATCLQADGHSVLIRPALGQALDDIARQVFDLIFADASTILAKGDRFLESLLKDYPWTKLIVVAEQGLAGRALEAMKLGASDYLIKPFTSAQAQLVTQKVLERRRLEVKVDALQAALGEMDPEADLPTESPHMRAALDLARKVSASNATVFICGEIGTGKGRLARAIHAWSPRATASFGEVSCETGSANELDAELFGMTRRDVFPPVDVPGRVEFCKGGTLALHDVVQTPPSLQPKLLRFLTDREFERYDDFKTREADTRVIATSSANPDEAVRQRRFRPELLLMLDVVRIELPPLRNRPEDIRMLVRRYLAHFTRENHRNVTDVSSEAMNALRKYPWPGNTRELRNLIERAVMLCRSEHIGLEHFPPNLLNAPAKFGIGDLVPLDTIEDLHIQRVLDSTGSIKGAAAVLGIGVSTMVRWMKRSKAALGGGDEPQAVETSPSTP
jgi:NtrC-family two-component system response regulator AlgB